MTTEMDLRYCFSLIDPVYQHIKARNDAYGAKRGNRKIETYEPGIELGPDGSGYATITSFSCESDQEFYAEWDKWGEMVPAIRAKVEATLKYFEAVAKSRENEQ